jgi:hypothetical protein
MFRWKRPSSEGHYRYIWTLLLQSHGYKEHLINTKMYIDLLNYLKITTLSTFNKVLFNVCSNLKPIWFVSLHFFSSMEEHGVLCLMITALQLYYGYYVVFYNPDFIQIWPFFIFNLTFGKSIPIFRLHRVRYDLLTCGCVSYLYPYASWRCVGVYWCFIMMSNILFWLSLSFVYFCSSGPLSLVRIIEELLEWKSSGSGLENRYYRP